MTLQIKIYDISFVTTKKKLTKSTEFQIQFH